MASPPDFGPIRANLPGEDLAITRGARLDSGRDAEPHRSKAVPTTQAGMVS